MKQECKVTVLGFVILLLFFNIAFADGGIYWQENGVILCEGTFGGGLDPLTIVSDSCGGAIISWDDGRHGSYGTIYAQRVGDIAGVEEEQRDQIRDQGFMLCYPNPFTTTATITLTFPSEGHRVKHL